MIWVSEKIIHKVYYKKYYKIEKSEFRIIETCIYFYMPF